MIIMVMIVMIMVVMVMVVIVVMMIMVMGVPVVMSMPFTEQMEMGMSAVSCQPLAQHPQSDPKDQQGREETEPAVELFFGVGIGKQFGNYAEDNDGKGVGKGNDGPEQNTVNRPAAGADHVCGNNGLAVSGFKGMQGSKGHGAEIKGNIMSHDQPASPP